MDLLLLLKSGWTLIEVGLSLPQCLCTFGKEKGFSLINPPTTFTIKGREWNRIFFAVDLDSSILGHLSQYSWHLLFAAWQNFSELLWGGKAKASTGDGQKSQAQEPGGAGCFILCNLETNQVPFIFFGICSASTELVNSESTLGRNVGWELQFTEASSCPWPLHFSTCTGCWVLLLNASLELRRDEKFINYKKNCLSNEDQYKSSYWGKQSHMQHHSNVGTEGQICNLRPVIIYHCRHFTYLSE